MVQMVLVLLYLYNGQFKLDQIPNKSMEACEAKAEQRVAELMKDPRVDDVLWGACIPMETTEASK